LIRRGINIRGGQEVNILSSINVKDVMYHTVEIIPETFLMKDLAKKLPQSRSNNFVVVDENERITGVLTFLDYYDKLFNEKLDNHMMVKDIMTTDVVTVSIEDNLSTAMEKISIGDYSILPVVSVEDPLKMVGIMTRRDILEAYDQAVIKKALN
jgi:CIC family chloride channel protein